MMVMLSLLNYANGPFHSRFTIMKTAMLLLLLGATQALGVVDGFEMEPSEALSTASASYAWVLLIIGVLALNLWVAFGGMRKWNNKGRLG
jgi:fumarate reductase subunit D